MSFSICLLSNIKSFFSLVAKEVKMNYVRGGETHQHTLKDTEGF